MSKTASRKVGDSIKIGFGTYTITSIGAIGLTHVPYYNLVNAKGVAYSFVPHKGLTKL